MGTLFGSNEGKIVPLSNSGTPAVVRINGLTGFTRLLVTDLGFGQGANVQFMNTLKDVVYIYSFGEKMGGVQVSGTLVLRSCVQTRAPVSHALQYYQQWSVSNVAKHKGKPIAISLSGQVLKGFLVGIRVSGFNPQYGTAKFTMSYASLPVGASAGTEGSGIQTIGGTSQVSLGPQVTL
jgi:hypothetical protein